MNGSFDNRPVVPHFEIVSRPQTNKIRASIGNSACRFQRPMEYPGHKLSSNNRKTPIAKIQWLSKNSVKKRYVLTTVNAKTFLIKKGRFL
jgi:hypothetical protein